MTPEQIAEYRETCLRVLREIATDPKADPEARVEAAAALLEYTRVPAPVPTSKEPAP